MAKSARQLDRDIAEALAHPKRMAKFLQGRKPQKAADRSQDRSPASRSSAFGARRSLAVPPTKLKAAKSKTTKPKPATKSNSRVAHSSTKKPGKQSARHQIEELIVSDEAEDWNVARDLAIEKDIQDMVVQLDMARALGVAPSDLKVTEGRPYDESFEVRLGRDQTYAVVPDEDTAHEIAIDRVKEDLKHEPELFSTAFVESHIDQKALKKWVYNARLDDDYVDELAEHQVDDFWDLARRLDVDKAVPDTDEEGNLKEPTRKQIAAVKKAYAEDASENPMSYFEDMFSHDEAVKQAIKAAGIDVKGAAEEAVNTDGWEHFLAHYDGSSNTTDSGLVYWRTN